MAESKFNFQQAVREMLVRMGARPSESYELVLDTRAGPLRLEPYDDWLATRFDSPEKAAETVRSGSLNRFSGKWNWHFIKPTADDVEFLEAQLSKVV